MAEIEFQADEEEKQDQAELAQHAEHTADCQIGKLVRHVVKVRPKDETPNGRRERLQNARAEDQPSDDFADDGRLPEAPG